MDKIIRNVNEQLWRQAKARAGFEGISLKQLVEEGLKSRLGYDSRSAARHLRNHLPEKANCTDCGREVLKEGKGKQRMILHHVLPVEKGGTDDPTNLVVVCPSCHKRRHLDLDGPTGGLGQYTKGEIEEKGYKNSSQLEEAKEHKRIRKNYYKPHSYKDVC